MARDVTKLVKDDENKQMATKAKIDQQNYRFSNGYYTNKIYITKQLKI